MFRALRRSAVAALCLVCSAVAAMAGTYQAGITRITVGGEGAGAGALVWYPTEDPESAWQAGPFRIAATREAPVARGRFPVVLLSHGRGGGPLSHRELAAQLARAGFIVVAPTHAGDSVQEPAGAGSAEVLRDRPAQVIAALDAMLQEDRLAAHADPDRLGLIGYSAGGYTGLVLAGARPDFGRAAAYCAEEGRADIGSCGPDGDLFAGVAETLATWSPPSGPRLGALVLLDPLAVMFDAPGLAAVDIPVLLYRPQDDVHMRSAPNARALAGSLPHPPQETVVPGQHFSFVAPCPPPVAAEAALVCSDAPGVDRAALHRRLEREIAAFLDASL